MEGHRSISKLKQMVIVGCSSIQPKVIHITPPKWPNFFIAKKILPFKIKLYKSNII